MDYRMAFAIGIFCGMILLMIIANLNGGDR